MAKQRIIAIGREYGSGGHKIGEILAKKYGVPLYDKEMIELIAKEKDRCNSTFCVKKQIRAKVLL